MSENTTTSNPMADGDCFPSLTALRNAHSEMLTLHREKGNEPEIIAKIEQLINKGRAMGALLDSEEDRWAAQSLLDYWNSLLYRAGSEPPDATLVDFDPSLAPDLSDDLCPYMGLEAFQQKNHNLFFGRQRPIERLLKHLETNRLLIVSGSSGSGKSSVVLGGLLARLIAGALSGSQNWVYYAPLVPGSDPLAALARRLKPTTITTTEWVPQQVSAFKKNPNHLVKLVEQPDRLPVVLVIDQFEEVFTLCRDEETRQILIKNLLNFIHTPDRRNILILTMRTDFESQLVRTPDLLALFDRSNIHVTALDAGELRETIENPAKMVGLKFDAGLIDTLLNDVLGETAALPLLQFTLLKLWDNREHNRVTWESYQQLGGGRLALAKSADEFYNNLILEKQLTVKRILLRMVRPSEGLEVTSSRIPRKELYLSGEASDRVDIVLDDLIKARLVRQTEGETPNDAQVEVAHEALIRNWPKLVTWLEDERINIRQRIRLTEAAEQWDAKGRDPSTLLRGRLLKDSQRYQDLNSLETEFIKSSKRVERKQHVIKLTSISGGLLFSILALIATAITKTHTDVLQQEKYSIAKEILSIKRLRVTQLEYSPDGKRILTVNTEGTARLWNTQGQLLSVLGKKRNITSAIFNLNGNLIAISGLDRTVELWDNQGRKILTLRGHKAEVTSVAFSPDGKIIATTSLDSTIRLWAVFDGSPISMIEDLSEITSIRFSPDGKSILTANVNGKIGSWNIGNELPRKDWEHQGI